MRDVITCMTGTGGGTRTQTQVYLAAAGYSNCHRAGVSWEPVLCAGLLGEAHESVFKRRLEWAPLGGLCAWAGPPRITWGGLQKDSRPTGTQGPCKEHWTRSPTQLEASLDSTAHQPLCLHFLIRAMGTAVPT